MTADRSTGEKAYKFITCICRASQTIRLEERAMIEVCIASEYGLGVS